jgi:hypothetical protein
LKNLLTVNNPNSIKFLQQTSYLKSTDLKYFNKKLRRINGIVDKSIICSHLKIFVIFVYVDFFKYTGWVRTQFTQRFFYSTLKRKYKIWEFTVLNKQSVYFHILKLKVLSKKFRKIVFKFLIRSPYPILNLFWLMIIYFFCSTLSELENFFLCERILINVTTCKKETSKLILKILRDLEPLRGSSNKKTLYSTRSCVNWAFLALVDL